MAEKAWYNIYLWHHTNLLPFIRFPHFTLWEMKQKQTQNASYPQSESIRLFKNKNRLKIIPGNHLEPKECLIRKKQNQTSNPHPIPNPMSNANTRSANILSWPAAYLEWPNQMPIPGITVTHHTIDWNQARVHII